MEEPLRVLQCLKQSYRASKYLSLVMRKRVFGVSDQAPHKPGCTTTEDG